MRVKETRRGKWAKGQIDGALTASTTDESFIYRLSGGEDVLGAARSIERVRAAAGSVSSFERSYGGGSGTNQQQRPSKTYQGQLHQQPMMQTYYTASYPPPAAAYQPQHQTRKPQSTNTGR